MIAVLSNYHSTCLVCFSFLFLITGDGDKPRNVTSYDLISNNPNYAPAHATSAEEKRVQLDKGIRIVTLAPGQRLNLECEAVLVTGLIMIVMLGCWQGACKVVSSRHCLNEIYSDCAHKQR